MTGNAVKMPDALVGWLHPAHAAPKPRCLGAGAAACHPAPGLSEDRVRGRTAARDACQRVASTQHTPDPEPSTSPRATEGVLPCSPVTPAARLHATT